MTKDAGVETFTAKVVIVGATSVGKTCIINKALTNSFKDVSPTLGANYSTKVIRLNNGVEVHLQIWDTAGDEQYRSIVPIFFRKASAAILVYSIDQEQSFKDIGQYVDLLNEKTDELFKVLVGNKSDLEDQRQVSIEEGNEYASCIEAEFFETSAKTGENINQLFQSLAQHVFDARINIIGQNETGNNNVNVGFTDYVNGNCC